MPSDRFIFHLSFFLIYENTDKVVLLAQAIKTVKFTLFSLKSFLFNCSFVVKHLFFSALKGFLRKNNEV